MRKELPSEVVCPFCKEMMNFAVMLPCCTASGTYTIKQSLLFNFKFEEKETSNKMLANVTEKKKRKKINLGTPV